MSKTPAPNLLRQEKEKSLFSFLHSFPPHTTIKLVSTAEQVFEINEQYDRGKLAIVPVEILLNLQQSFRYNKELTDK